MIEDYDITLVIPTCERPETLRRTFEELDRNLPTYGRISVLLIQNDNGEQPKGCGRTQLVKLGKNRGNAVARNVGVANASTSLVFFLDDDSWPGREVIERAVRRFALDPQLGLIACRVVSPEYKPVSRVPDTFGREVEAWTGCGGIVRRELVESFSEWGLLASAWEWELVAMVRSRGFAVKAFEDIFVHHTFSQEGSGAFRNSTRKRYEAVRVPILYWARFGPAKQLLWHGWRWAHAIAQATIEQRTALYLKGYASTLRLIPWAWRGRRPVSAAVAARLRPTLRFKGK